MESWLIPLSIGCFIVGLLIGGILQFRKIKKYGSNNPESERSFWCKEK
jgi:uncharacterized protein YneF (UPF0154 family)